MVHEIPILNNKIEAEKGRHKPADIQTRQLTEAERQKYGLDDAITGARIKPLADKGMTVREIAEALGSTDKIVGAVMDCHQIKKIYKAKTKEVEVMENNKPLKEFKEKTEVTFEFAGIVADLAERVVMLELEAKKRTEEVDKLRTVAAAFTEFYLYLSPKNTEAVTRF